MHSTSWLTSVWGSPPTMLHVTGVRHAWVSCTTNESQHPDCMHHVAAAFRSSQALGSLQCAQLIGRIGAVLWFAWLMNLTHCFNLPMNRLLSSGRRGQIPQLAQWVLHQWGLAEQFKAVVKPQASHAGNSERHPLIQAMVVERHVALKTCCQILTGTASRQLFCGL